MTRYVAGFLFADLRTRVLLVRKARPNWQKGKLNGIGGHIEPGETPEQAMSREFAEETGIRIDYWRCFATLIGKTDDKPWEVFWYVSAVAQSADYKLISQPDEPVGWYPLNTCRETMPPVMPNLHWLIPMAKGRIEALENVKHFTIHEGYYSTE